MWHTSLPSWVLLSAFPRSPRRDQKRRGFEVVCRAKICSWRFLLHLIISVGTSHGAWTREVV